ncbi:MAG: SLBB domain-containing protein, partial [Bacteroidota bacterium]
FCFFALLSFGQIPAAQLAQAQAELAKRGITEAEMRMKLEEKGINVDAIDATNPSEVVRVQKAVEEILREIDAGKRTKKNNSASTSSTNDGTAKTSVSTDAPPSVQETTENIKDAVKEGASVEEALSEELNETQQKEYPKATIYGQQLFRDQSLKLFRTTTDAKPPNSYVLGTGDEVSVSIFGISQADFTFEIPESGFIKPAGMPRILLKGITYGQAKKLLRNRFGAAYVFQPEQFAVTLSTARTITVNIFGEVLNFGSFNISALNTAFNALVAAGGPSNIGSVRNIQVISNGKSKRLDVYEFMNNPAAQFDFSLNNNDIINIPVAQRVVRIEGAVRRPFRYELLDNENLNDLISYAGGLKDNAYRSNIQIIRFENDKEVITDIDLSELQRTRRDFKLLAGDIVSIKEVERTYENFVSIEGAVEIAGRFELSDRMRIGDLIQKAVLRKEARTDIAYLYRTGADNTVTLSKINLDNILADSNSPSNLSLQPKDKLQIYGLGRFTEQPTISVVGAVRDSRETYEIDPAQTVRLQDAVVLAGGLTDNATDFAYIIRSNINNPEKKDYIRVEIKSAVQDPSSSENVILQPYDQLRIPRTETYTDPANVTITGAIRQPGEFRYAETLTLRDLLALAGGLKREAASNRIDIFRIQFNGNEPTQSVVAT